MAAESATDLSHYVAKIKSEDLPFQKLLTELTIGETFFFREPGQFEYLRTTVFPELMRNRPPGSTVRVWSAGCATGEEAYSLAAVLHEAGLGDSSAVLGTDLSPKRIEHARSAIYSRWSLRGVPEAVVDRYFRRSGRSYHLVPQLTRTVRFAALNLNSDSYPSLASGIRDLDVIFCRNVLIYLDAPTVKAIATRLLNSLRPDGWLFLGASDPALGELLPCRVVVTGAGIAYRRPDVPSGRSTPRRPPAAPSTERATELPLRAQSHAAGAPSPAPSSAPPEAVDSAAAVAYAARDYARAAESARTALEQSPTAELWVIVVRALANQGKLGDSLRACLNGLAEYPTSAELVYLQAVLLRQSNRAGEAVSAVRRALYLDRSFSVAHLLLADLLLPLGDGAGATRALRNAERLLARIPADQIVPASEGERAGRLLESTRLRLKLAGEVT